MTDEQTTKRKSDIHLSQLVVTALAAITAAFLGSRLGVAGTITGAGLASTISTLAGALYQRSLDRTARTVRTVRSKVNEVRNGHVGDPATPDTAPSDTAVVTTTSGVLSVSGSLGNPAAPGTVRTLEVDPEAPTVFLRPLVRPPRRRLTLKTAIALTAGAFLIGMAAVTGFELLHHGPVSGGNNGTTIGSLFGQATERPTPSTPKSNTPAPPSTTTNQTTTTGRTAPTTTTTPPATTTPADSATQAPTTTTPPPTTTTAPTTTDVAP